MATSFLHPISPPPNTPGADKKSPEGNLTGGLSAEEREHLVRDLRQNQPTPGISREDREAIAQLFAIAGSD